jgi:hypothetical protein
VALLWHHVKEVREHKQALLGALVVTLVLGLAGWALPLVLPRVVPLLPAALIPWLSAYRLSIAGAVLMVFLAQYLAWRKQYLANHPEGPEIDERLELLEEAPSLTIHDDATTRRLEQMFPTEPYPEHNVSARLRSKSAIDHAILTVQCTAPIYRVLQFYCEAGETEPVMVLPRIGYRQPQQDLIVATFKDGPLAPGSSFLIKIFSPVPIALKRVSIGPMRPPAPPPVGPPSTTGAA